MLSPTQYDKNMASFAAGFSLYLGICSLAFSSLGYIYVYTVYIRDLVLDIGINVFFIIIIITKERRNKKAFFLLQTQPFVRTSTYIYTGREKEAT